jgi:hypothetical protein
MSPIFDDPLPVVRNVLGAEPSPGLLARLSARKGRRSPTEQPSDEQRLRARLRVL